MIKMYGISTCTTVGKAQKWLKENGVEFEFYNYKEKKPDPKKIDEWFAKFGWEKMLKKNGTTWRELDPKLKADMNEVKARKLMLEHHNLIQRPITETGKETLFRFDEDEFRKALS